MRTISAIEQDVATLTPPKGMREPFTAGWRANVLSGELFKEAFHALNAKDCRAARRLSAAALKAGRRDRWPAARKLLRLKAEVIQRHCPRTPRRKG